MHWIFSSSHPFLNSSHVARGGARHFYLGGPLEGPVLQQGELSMVCVGLLERDLQKVWGARQNFLGKWPPWHPPSSVPACGLVCNGLIFLFLHRRTNRELWKCFSFAFPTSVMLCKADNVCHHLKQILHWLSYSFRFKGCLIISMSFTICERNHVRTWRPSGQNHLLPHTSSYVKLYREAAESEVSLADEIKAKRDEAADLVW